MAATGTPTTNIGLRRPQGTDPASVDDINYNSEVIDTKMGAVGNTSVQAQLDALNSKISRYVDVQITLGTSAGNVNSDIPSWSSAYNILSATFLYNNDLYYSVMDDKRTLTLSIRANGTVTILQEGGPWSGTRTVTVRVHYA